MKTVSDVLCFLSELDLREKKDKDLVIERRCIKIFLFTEFGDFKITTMISALNIFHGKVVSDIANELDSLA